PRPQALAIPLQLVAYLPIVETKASDALIFRNRLDQVLSRIIKKPLLGRISDPNDPEFEELNLILSEQLNKSDNGSFLDRFNHWVKYWCANPFAG
ncbi:hypothetical protein, partial [Pseudomonas viridiflava]